MFLHLIFWILFAFTDRCANEDSSFCSWHAAEQGNGIGSDFVRIGDVQINGLYHEADGTTSERYSWTVEYVEG